MSNWPIGWVEKLLLKMVKSINHKGNRKSRSITFRISKTGNYENFNNIYFDFCNY